MRRRSVMALLAAVAVAVAVGVVVLATGVFDGPSEAPTTTPTTTSPGAPPTTVPSRIPKGSGLGTPLTCPAGAVAVRPGHVPSLAAGTAYCFAAGTYRRPALRLKSGDRLFGQGKAVLNGEKSVPIAIQGSGVATAVIDGFTIENYSEPDAEQQPGVINIISGSHVTISDNVIGPDQTSGVSLGGGCTDYGQVHTAVPDAIVTHNVVRDVGASGISLDCGDDQTVSYNTVSYTNLWNLNTEYDVHAIGKFVYTRTSHVIGNYVLNNADHGIWYDGFASGSTIEDNAVVKSSSSGIFYEISYNAVISDNTLSGNGYAKIGAEGAPGAGISISSSGWSDGPGAQRADLGQPGPRGILISHNTLTANHEGIYLFAGHTEAVPTNNVTVTDNSTTLVDTHWDAYAAGVDLPGDDNTWSSNHYVVSVDQFVKPSNKLTNWAGWQAAGYDRTGTCHFADGRAC